MRAAAYLSVWTEREEVSTTYSLERLWRTLKYEDIYKRSYETPQELYEGLNSYFSFYNRRRLHQALSYSCPEEVWLKSLTQNRASAIIAGGQK
ncbi:MAG TPA: integrase core domain-containing protein [Leptospiraceae bacterium]|nr:integrase core domain-containing protein [Leptospiraceae bacterium]